MEALKLYLDQFVRLQPEELAAFMELFTEVEFKKHDYFARSGTYEKKLGVLEKGVMRAFFRNDAGKEYNKTFFTPVNFVAAYAALTTRQVNQINIQCLTNCKLWVADYQKLTALFEEFSSLERLARIWAERKFALKEKREIELVTLEAKARYAIFKAEHPGLENQISQYHIASYLGITPTQLSRIRAKG